MKNLTCHTHSINALTLLPNGYLASASADYNIMLWNISKAYPLYTLSGHTNAVRSLVVIQNQFLASSSSDLSIKLWSLSSFSLVRSWEASKSVTLALAYDPTLDLLASGEQSPANMVKLWDFNLWTSELYFFFIFFLF